jgi:hypothetical protein
MNQDVADGGSTGMWRGGSPSLTCADCFEDTREASLDQWPSVAVQHRADFHRREGVGWRRQSHFHNGSLKRIDYAPAPT